MCRQLRNGFFQSNLVAQNPPEVLKAKFQYKTIGEYYKSRQSLIPNLCVIFKKELEIPLKTVSTFFFDGAGGFFREETMLK